VAAIEEVVGEELDRPVRWGRCRVVDPEVVGAPSGDAPRKRTGPETLTDANSKGRERKVIRAPGCGYGCGCGYGRPDPQGMPLTGNTPWGTPGHAANRHCPLGPAPAPVTPPPRQGRVLVVSWIMTRVRIWEKHRVVCGFSWLLRVIDHEAALMDPKLFSSWVHRSVVLLKRWFGRQTSSRWRFSRKNDWAVQVIPQQAIKAIRVLSTRKIVTRRQELGWHFLLRRWVLTAVCCGAVSSELQGPSIQNLI
jgi:hypothetical protein